MHYFSASVVHEVVWNPKIRASANIRRLFVVEHFCAKKRSTTSDERKAKTLREGKDEPMNVSLRKLPKGQLPTAASLLESEKTSKRLTLTELHHMCARSCQESSWLRQWKTKDAIADRLHRYYTLQWRRTRSRLLFQTIGVDSSTRHTCDYMRRLF